MFIEDALGLDFLKLGIQLPDLLVLTLFHLLNREGALPVILFILRIEGEGAKIYFVIVDRSAPISSRAKKLLSMRLRKNIGIFVSLGMYQGK